jgi:glutathione S-transferase
MRWQFWDSSHFSPQLGMLMFQKVLKPMFGLGEPDAGRIEEALTNFRRFAAVLDRRLDGRQYVVGDALTLADLTLAPSLMYAKQTQAPLAEFPNIQGWFSRISDMDAWTRTNP